MHGQSCSPISTMGFWLGLCVEYSYCTLVNCILCINAGRKEYVMLKRVNRCIAAGLYFCIGCILPASAGEMKTVAGIFCDSPDSLEAFYRDLERAPANSSVPEIVYRNEGCVIGLGYMMDEGIVAEFESQDGFVIEVYKYLMPDKTLFSYKKNRDKYST